MHGTILQVRIDDTHINITIITNISSSTTTTNISTSTSSSIMFFLNL